MPEKPHLGVAADGVGWVEPGGEERARKGYGEGGRAGRAGEYGLCVD